MVPIREDLQSAPWQGGTLSVFRPDTKPAIYAVSRPSGAYWRKEVICVATQAQIDAAIAHATHSPATTKPNEWELVKKAASQGNFLGSNPTASAAQKALDSK